MDGFILEKASVNVTFPDDSRLGELSGKTVSCCFDYEKSELTISGKPVTGYPKEWVIQSGILEPGY